MSRDQMLAVSSAVQPRNQQPVLAVNRFQVEDQGENPAFWRHLLGLPLTLLDQSWQTGVSCYHPNVV